MNNHSHPGTSSHSLSTQTPFQVGDPILPTGVRTRVFQAVPLVLDFCPMILGSGIEVDESKWLDIPIVVVSIALERLPFSLGCLPILHQLLVLSILAVWRSHPASSLAGVTCDAEDPCSVNAIDERESSLTTSLVVQHGLCCFGTCCPIQFFEVAQVHELGKLICFACACSRPLVCFRLLILAMLVSFGISPTPCKLRPSHPESSLSGA